MSTAFETVYLWRKGNPQYWADAFFESWIRHDPGDDVRLTLLLKGFNGIVPRAPKPLAQRLDIVHVSDAGFDLTAYKSIASLHPEKVFLFLNSHSRIEAPSWYTSLSTAWKMTEGQGLVGVSGSWETIPSGQTFPNVHLRTNGFVVSAQNYLQAADALESRKDCLLFEAGEDSLTQHFLQQDLPVLVANSNGKAFSWRDWPKSRTFRFGDQESLLISDNRTRHYHYGSTRKRNALSNASWGSQSNVARVSALNRLRRLIWVRFLYFGHKLQSLTQLKSPLS